MDNSGITIETTSLFLKAITLDYKDDIFREFTAEITTYMASKPPEKIEDTVSFIERAMKGNRAGSDLETVMLGKSSREFLGCCGLADKPQKQVCYLLFRKSGGCEEQCYYCMSASSRIKTFRQNLFSHQWLFF